MDKREYAVELKHNGGCNCCQAVLCSFAEELGQDPALLKKLGAAFGVGMGCQEATCGSLCAVEMMLGLKQYEGRPVLRTAAALHEAFRGKCGATICKEIKGRDTGVMLCSCDDCVRYAVDVAEEML